MRIEAASSKIEQYRGTMATIAIASSLAKKIESASIVGPTKACSDRRSGENKYGNGAF